MLLDTALQKCRRTDSRLSELHQQALDEHSIIRQRQARVLTGEVGELMEGALREDEVETTGVPQRFSLRRL